MAKDIFEDAEESAAVIRRQINVVPRVAVVLGSGLGSFAENIEDPMIFPYASLPHFPRSTVQGHSGQLVVGRVGSTAVAAMQGRVHGYEGYTPEEVTFPMRVLGRLGIRSVIVTNAAGALRLDLRPGQLVLLKDHINLTGRNPVSGPNDIRLGPRFFDMGDAYCNRLRSLATAVAARQGLSLPEGIYLGLSGPSYETPAEIRAFRILGADLVGMSTVHEVIVARHMGIEVVGLSCVTNMAAGILDQKITHEEVFETGARAQKDLSRLLAMLLPELDGAAQSRASN